MKKNLFEYWQKFWELFDDPVIQGFAVALAGIPIYIAADLPRLTINDQKYISESIQWFGVPYGFIIAYVLANVWTQFESAKRVFDQEADNLLMLYQAFLLSSNKRVILKIEKEIIEYVKLVLEYYFPSHEVLRDEEVDSEEKQEDKEVNHLKEIRGNIKILLNSRKDHDLAIELLRLLNKVTDNRGDRMYLISQKMPVSIGYLALIASATWIIPFYAVQFSSPLVGAIYIVAITVVVVSIIFIIFDLNEPIGGLWGLEPNSWIDVEKDIKKEIINRENT